MSYDDYRLRMEKLQHLIKMECTGNVDELSDKLGISRRTLLNDVATLRDNGSVIKFCRYRKTYYYDNQ
jgi:predicted DNA-binding transcriptional regulator YafY